MPTRNQKHAARLDQLLDKLTKAIEANDAGRITAIQEAIQTHENPPRPKETPRHG